MKIQTISIVTAATILLVGCGKQSGSSGTASAPANQQSSAESAATAVNPTGTWKVTHSSTNTQVRTAENTLKLTLDGGTLTGTISDVSTVNGKSRVYEWPIKEAKLQGSEISFSVTHPFNVGHGEVTSSYQGKISDDVIKGTFTTELLGQTNTRDWKAERLKE